MGKDEKLHLQGDLNRADGTVASPTREASGRKAKKKATGEGWSADPSAILRVGPGFRLADVDTSSTPGFGGNKEDGKRELAQAADELAELQTKLFAASLFGGRRRLLLVLQAMDTAGKGGIVKHVVGSVDPQGIHHHAFKAPTEEEKRHNFLWRIRRELPAAGLIGVFDRSHYEEVLIHRVRSLSAPDEVERRYGIINQFERELVQDEHTTVVKVMLHIGKDEQKRRLQARLDTPEKHWKYSPGDLAERSRWDDYQEAYQIALERTSTPEAPWHVVPADNKWYARIAVQRLVASALEGMDLQWPAADYDVEEQKRLLADS